MCFIVGQELFFQQDRMVISGGSLAERKGYLVTITEVGRKWLKLSNGKRIDKITLKADGKGYSSTGRCFLSESDFCESVARETNWRNLRANMTFAVPDGVSAEDILRAAELLGITREEITWE